MTKILDGCRMGKVLPGEAITGGRSYPGSRINHFLSLSSLINANSIAYTNVGAMTQGVFKAYAVPFTDALRKALDKIEASKACRPKAPPLWPEELELPKAEDIPNAVTTDKTNQKNNGPDTEMPYNWWKLLSILMMISFPIILAYIYALNKTS